MHYSEALQLNQPCYTYVILPSIQEINTMNASNLFLNAMTTFSPALNLQGFHSSADLESILMSNYLLTDEGRDTQELPPSHLSVHRSNNQTIQVTQVHNHNRHVPAFLCPTSSRAVHYIGTAEGSLNSKSTGI